MGRRSRPTLRALGRWRSPRDWPPDVAAAIAQHPTYPALFAAAFGDAAISPQRLAFALATYQRTLVADETAWDRYDAGDTTALTGRALYGWRAFQSFHCTACHTPPLFTNDDFFQIGLRRADFDRGRENITHDPEDAGEMKVPSLRNAALRPRFMHTGEFTSLGAAIRFYINTLALPERDGIPGAGLYTFNMSGIDEADLREFITTALTDPRVRDETFPFDRPVLRSERATSAAGCNQRVAVTLLPSGHVQHRAHRMGKPGNTGLRRIVNATFFSFAGLRAAWRHEAAFRQEVLLCVVLVPTGVWLGRTAVERALLIGSCLLVLIVELLNSGIEAVVDRVGAEHHELSGQAKDLGSAAVFLSLALVVVIFGLIAWERFGPSAGSA